MTATLALGPRAAAAALATSRRVSSGIGPEAGATSRLPAAWGVDDWTQLELPAAVYAHRDLCREHHVDPDTVVAVGRGMAYYADHRTGRDCRPTNALLREHVRVSQSTVQRARRVLKALGLVRVVVKGRSFMTRDERLAAWRRGSSHRRIAAVFVLTSRGRERARGALSLVGGGASKRTPSQLGRGALWGSAPAHLVERDHPPGALSESASLKLGRGHLRGTTEQRRGRSAPAHTEEVDGPRPRGFHPATQRLAEAARRRLAWLAGTSARRTAPTLHRFAQAGWTARDVERAVVASMASKGWRIVPTELAQPAAYLATLLRDVDPADRPGAVDELEAARERAQRAYERQLVIGSPCPHGQPAGDVPSPLRGHLACPACRTAAAAAAVEWPTVRGPGAS